MFPSPRTGPWPISIRQIVRGQETRGCHEEDAQGPGDDRSGRLADPLRPDDGPVPQGELRPQRRPAGPPGDRRWRPPADEAVIPGGTTESRGLVVPGGGGIMLR